MKVLRKIQLLCLLFLITGSLAGSGKVMAQPGVSISFQAFYDELAPYGRWIDYQNYGRVWIPAVEAGFQPYGTGGHWIVTEYGNTWVSDYDWGWAPFHYGRWIYDDYYGWIWVPGNEWGPAWVTWRSGGGYYGWAPLGPGVDISVNINIPLLRWIFVPEHYITSPRVYSYCIPRGRSANIYRSTTIINNIYVNNNRRYFYGPRPQEIERATRSRVTIHHIDNMDRPGRAMANNGSLRIYRPQVTDRNRPDSHYSRPDNSKPDWNNRGDRNRPDYRDRQPDRNPSNPGNSRPDRNQPATSSQGKDNNNSNPNNVSRNDRNNREEQKRSWEVQKPSSNSSGNQQNNERNNREVNREEQRRRWETQRSLPNSSGNQQNNSQEQRERWNQQRQAAEQRSSNSQREEQRRQSYGQDQRQQRPERSSGSYSQGSSQGRERNNSSGDRSSSGNSGRPGRR